MRSQVQLKHVGERGKKKAGKKSWPKHEALCLTGQGFVHDWVGNEELLRFSVLGSRSSLLTYNDMWAREEGKGRLGNCEPSEEALKCNTQMWWSMERAVQKGLMQTQVGLIFLAATSNSWLTLDLALTEITRFFFHRNSFKSPHTHNLQVTRKMSV